MISTSPGSEAALDSLFTAARAERREQLTEFEALELVRALGIGVPDHALVADAAEARALDLRRFPGTRVVLKAISPSLLHKTEQGAVAVVRKETGALAAAVEEMGARLRGQALRGFAVVEFVEHDPGFGGELLLSLRFTADFGPVVTLGPGGVQAEHLARELRPERAISIFSPELPLPADPLAKSALGPVLTAAFRGQPPRLAAAAVRELLGRCLDFAARHCPQELLELEVNPLVFTGRGPVALDALARLGNGPRPEAPPRPAAKIARMLEPRSIAIVGVSERMNPGHLILANLLREGFPREQVTVIKPNTVWIEGCNCVESLAALPAPVDLLVLAVDAPQVPALLAEVVKTRKAESVIVIPGGLGELAGTEEAAAGVRKLIAGARATDWQGPVVNGGNCLGIRSRPGRYDTLFIPGHKLGIAGGAPSPLAILSQSGAFVVSRANRLAGLNPSHLVSFGNQLDLTAGDWLEHFAGDPHTEVIGCYVEGFQPGDGRRFLRAAAKITASGRSVILYRAGRTAAGAGAAASHSASIAGDFAVTRALCERAGVVVADSLADFDDLIGLFLRLRHKRPRGNGVGAVSNAGFECVAFADSLGGLELARFAPATEARLAELLRRRKLDGIVSVHHPLDLTPMLGDEGYAEAFAAVLDDPGVDLAVIGVIPMTATLSTLAPGPGHGEDAGAETAVAVRLARLAQASAKPVVAVIDAGALYDPMAAALETRGVPVLRSADRALRLLGTWCAARLR